MLQRPQGNQVSRLLQPGDHLVIHKLDRGFRDAEDALRMINAWMKEGITVHIISFPVQDLSGAMGKLMLTIFAAFAEWERNQISERTKEGLRRAKAAGRTGRHPSMEETPEGRLELLQVAVTSYLIRSKAPRKVVRELNRRGWPRRDGTAHYPKNFYRKLKRARKLYGYQDPQVQEALKALRDGDDFWPSAKGEPIWQATCVDPEPDTPPAGESGDPAGGGPS